MMMIIMIMAVCLCYNGRKEGRTIRSGCAIGGSPRINYIIINYDYELKLKLISSRSVIIVRPIL